DGPSFGHPHRVCALCAAPNHHRRRQLRALLGDLAAGAFAVPAALRGDGGAAVRRAGSEHVAAREPLLAADGAGVVGRGHRGASSGETPVSVALTSRLRAHPSTEAPTDRAVSATWRSAPRS